MSCLLRTSYAFSCKTRNVCYHLRILHRMCTDNVTVEREKHSKVATLVLGRSPVNSLNIAFTLQLLKTLKEVEDSSVVDAIIFKSSLQNVFSAGLDLNELYGNSRDHLECFWEAVQNLWFLIYSSKLVTLSLINGHCLAAGTIIAAASDYRLAIEGNYSIGVTAAKVGLIAPPWFLVMLSHLMGRRRTEHALQTGHTFTPSEAVEVGLVDQVCSSELAQDICSEVLMPYLLVSQESRWTMKRFLRAELLDYFHLHRNEDRDYFVDYVMKESVQKQLGGTQRLPRLVGIGKAKELIFTAKICSGLEAEEIGLVEHSVPQNENGDSAYQKALEIAKQIADKGPIAVTMAKLSIDNGMQTDLNTALKIEESCYSQVIPTEDRLEALRAFSEKRKPNFLGK